MRPYLGSEDWTKMDYPDVAEQTVYLLQQMDFEPDVLVASSADGGLVALHLMELLPKKPFILTFSRQDLPSQLFDTVRKNVSGMKVLLCEGLEVGTFRGLSSFMMIFGAAEVRSLALATDRSCPGVPDYVLGKDVEESFPMERFAQRYKAVSKRVSVSVA